MKEYIEDATGEALVVNYRFLTINQNTSSGDAIAIPVNRETRINVDFRNPQGYKLLIKIFDTISGTMLYDADPASDTYKIDGEVKVESMASNNLSAIITITNPNFGDKFNLSVTGTFNGRPMREAYPLPRIEAHNFYTLTVNSGTQTGAGEYLEGTGVPITADDPSDGQLFKNWTTNNGGTFVNDNASNTVFIMSDKDVTVTANYTDFTEDVVLWQDDHDFGDAEYGYSSDDISTLAVSVGNPLATGDSFTVSLSDDDAFTLTGTNFYLDRNSTLVNAIKVSPKTGLGAGTYAATVTVSGTKGNTASFDVSFEVKKATPSVTVWPTSATEIGKGQQLSASTLIGGAASVEGTFVWKAPATTLSSAGTFPYAVIFKPEDNANYNDVDESKTVSVTVNNYGVTLYDGDYELSTTYYFDNAIVGYATAPPALTVTVKNTGDKQLTALNYSILPNNTNFVLSSSGVATLSVGATTSFTVRPNTGLPIGSYSAVVTVSSTSTYFTKSFTVYFDVTDIPCEYSIKDNGSSYTATRYGTRHIVTDGNVQAVINAIKDDANGAACTIQFGEGTQLDIKAEQISFSNTGGSWGAITLKGTLTSQTTNTMGTINISAGVTVNSEATISHATRTITNYGTLNITGGTVSLSSGSSSNYAVYNGADAGGSVSKINITGGTVNGGNGRALYNGAYGEITISGGNVSAYSNTIYQAEGALTISSGNVTASSNNTIQQNGGTVSISGGTITNTNGSGTTISQESVAGILTISGGTVTNTGGGNVILKTSSTALTITGGTIRAEGGASSGVAIYYTNGSCTISATTGDTLITSSNKTYGTIYVTSSASALTVNGGTVTNTASGDLGNAIYIDNGVKPTISVSAIIYPPYSP